MKTTKSPIRFGLLTLMILTAALSRIIPHAWNFAPIGAIALFGAAYFSNRIIAFVIPLASMWLSDVVLNNTVYANSGNGVWLFPHHFPWNYLGFLLIIPVGLLLLKKVKTTSVTGTSLIAAIVFFLVSNFGIWLGNSLYKQTFSGLMNCYAVAIPFFWNTLAGDLFYAALLFGVFELAQRRFPSLQINKQPIYQPL
jgi:hypothetical protein